MSKAGILRQVWDDIGIRNISSSHHVRAELARVSTVRAPPNDISGTNHCQSYVKERLPQFRTAPVGAHGLLRVEQATCAVMVRTCSIPARKGCG